jgi:hypothetical protein
MINIQLGDLNFLDSDFQNFSYLTGIPDSLLAAFNIADTGYGVAVTGLVSLSTVAPRAFDAEVSQDNFSTEQGGVLLAEDSKRSASLRKTANLATQYAFVTYQAIEGLNPTVEGNSLKESTLTGVQSGGMRLYEHPKNLDLFTVIPAGYGSVNGVAQILGSSINTSADHAYLSFHDFLIPSNEGVAPNGTAILSGTYYVGKWVYVKARTRPVPVFQDIYPSNTSRVISRFGYQADTTTSGTASDNRFGCVRIIVNRGSSHFASYGTEGFVSAVSGGRVTFTARFKGEDVIGSSNFSIGLRSSSSPMGPRFLTGNALGFEVDGVSFPNSLQCVLASNGTVTKGSTSIVWQNNNVVELVIDPAFSIARWFLNNVKVFEASLDGFPDIKESLLTKAYSFSSATSAPAIEEYSVSIDFIRLHKIVSR